MQVCIFNSISIPYLPSLSLFPQLEDARKGSKEGSRERNEKVAAARSKIEVIFSSQEPPTTTLSPLFSLPAAVSGERGEGVGGVAPDSPV